MSNHNDRVNDPLYIHNGQNKSSREAELEQKLAIVEAELQQYKYANDRQIENMRRLVEGSGASSEPRELYE